MADTPNQSPWAGWSQYPDRQSQELSALRVAKNLNQAQQPQSEAKPEKPPDEQLRKEAHAKLAQKLADSSFSRVPEFDRQNTR
jgi:hypothetical protein